MRPCAGQYSRDQAIAQAGIPKYANAAKEAGPATASLDVEAGERMSNGSSRGCAVAPIPTEAARIERRL
jgi:hypothetical protein